MEYSYNFLKKGVVFYLIILIVLSQSLSIIALNEDFYPGCNYQNGKIVCTSTGERSSGFYIFAGGSACCGCTIRHYGTLPDEFPSVNANIVTFYVTTSRSNSYYTTIQNGPNDLKLILGNYESVATSIELSSINNDPVEHSWILQFEFDSSVSIGGGTTWELLDGDDNIYSAVWLHASDLDQEGLPGVFENTNCQYAETRNLWYSVKFETEGEIIDDDEEEDEETEKQDININKITTGGPYRIFTVDENKVEISVELENKASIYGIAVVKLEKLPSEIVDQTGLVTRAVNISGNSKETVDFSFTLSEYDWIEGWDDKGFSAGTYNFDVIVYDSTGSSIYDSDSGSFVVNKGPVFEPTKYMIDYDGNSNYKIETDEKFLLSIRINNTGDENVKSHYMSSIILDFKKGGELWEGIKIDGYGWHFNLSNDVTFKPGDIWWPSHETMIITDFPEEYQTTTLEGIANFFNWTATTTGLAKINFYINYEDVNGNRHHTMLKYPVKIPIHDYTGKTILTEQVTTNGDLEVTVYAIEDNPGDVKISTKIRNIGEVYYTYKIDGSPSCPDKYCVNELLSFLAPKGQKKIVVSSTDYKFRVWYDYSSTMNTLDGLLMAIEPLLPPPVDKVPDFIEIILLVTQQNLDIQQKFADEGVKYLVEKLVTDESFQNAVTSAVVNKVIDEYGENAGQKVLEQMGSDFFLKIGKLTVAFYKVFNWAWNNIKAPIGGEFEVTVVDPPLEYTTISEVIPGKLYFGGFDNETINDGEGNIKLILNENDNDEYQAEYIIDNSRAIMDDTVFDVFSKIIIHEYGQDKSSVLSGNVEITIYPSEDSNLLDSLFENPGLIESIVESYFIKMDDFETEINNNFVTLIGIGELKSNLYDKEVDNTITITPNNITASFYSKGEYSEKVDNILKANFSFGPRINIPLKNTKLELIIPNEVESITPNPDSTNGAYIWDQTPSDIKISANLDSQTPGFEFLLVIISILGILIVMWYRKKL